MGILSDFSDFLFYTLQHLFWCDADCQHRLEIFDIYIGGIVVLISLIFSLFFVKKHLNNYTNGEFQDKIIVILFMSPFYSITSYIGISFPQTSEILALIRDVYEAFILFTFFYLIHAYIGYDPEQDQVVQDKIYTVLVEVSKECHHLFPFDWCSKPYKFSNQAKAKYFVYRCKKFILQFLVIKPGATFLVIILHFVNQNKEERSVETFLEIIQGISVTFSLYYLILFYHALKEPLAPYSPLLKFLTIKITLFFTFWQKLFLKAFEEAILKNFDEKAPHFHGHVIIARIENSLICVEMLILSIVGGLAFHYRDFVTHKRVYGNLRQVIKNNWYNFLVDFRLIRPKKFGFKHGGTIHDQERFSQQQRRLDSIKKKQEFQVELLEMNGIDQHLISAYV